MEVISQTHGDHGILDGGGEVVQRVRGVAAVQALPPTVGKPVVEVTAGFQSELVHFEGSLLECSVCKCPVERGLHVQFQVEEIILFLDVCYSFEKGSSACRVVQMG